MDIPVCKNLSQQFEIKRFLGKGSDGVVYEVFDRRVKKNKAMKFKTDFITDPKTRERHLAFHLYRKVAILTPHLIPIESFSYLPVEPKCFDWYGTPNVWANKKFPPVPTKDKCWYSPVVVMQLMEGDRTSLNLSEKEQLALDVQVKSAMDLLRRLDIFYDDSYRWDNQLWCSTNAWNGFDYLEYQIGKDHYYLPKMNTVIALCDYGGWKLRNKWDCKQRTFVYKGTWPKSSVQEETRQKWLKAFPKPKTGKILKMPYWEVNKELLDRLGVRTEEDSNL